MQQLLMYVILYTGEFHILLTVQCAPQDQFVYFFFFFLSNLNKFKQTGKEKRKKEKEQFLFFKATEMLQQSISTSSFL